MWRNIKRFPDAQVTEDILVLRTESDIYFVNASRFRDKCLQMLQQFPAVKAVVLDASTINFLDIPAISVLQTLLDDLKKRNIMFVLCNARGPVRDFLRKCKFHEKMRDIDPKWDIDHAVTHIHSQLIPTPGSNTPNNRASLYFT